MLHISIIICTYNRFERLSETLTSILNIIESDAGYEIIVVDNNSSDKTSSIKELYDGNNSVKYYLEKNQGLSHARNRVIIESQGEILVFLDDDVDLPKDYFEVIKNIFSKPDVHIVGGKVLPHNVSVPDWLPLKYYYMVSLFDLGDEERVVEKVMGANYAMRVDVAATVGWYNPELGRKGTSLMGGEEVDYLDRARLSGYEVWYNPYLIVYHKINEKLNYKYIYDYAFLLGKSEALIDSNKGRVKVLTKFFKSLGAIIIQKMASRFFNSAKRKTYLKIIEQYGFGYIKNAKFD